MPGSALYAKHQVPILLAAGLVTAIMGFRLSGEGYGGSPMFFGLAVFFAFTLWYFALGVKGNLEALRAVFERRPQLVWLIPAVSTLLYALYSLGTGYWETFQWRIGFYYFTPFVILAIFPSSAQRLTWQDLLVIPLIWFPVNLGWVQGAWPWPGNMGSYAYMMSSAVPLIVALMVAYRQLDGVKFEWSLSRRDWRHIAVNFSVFCVIAIPFGLATDFIQWGGLKFEPSAIAFTFLITFIWIAVPEELLFRGFIQNLLQKTWSRHPALTIGAASLIFGLAHMTHGDSPDWRYIVLASIAGFFYGRTFNQCRSFVPAVIVHALVDTVWIHFFRG